MPEEAKEEKKEKFFDLELKTTLVSAVFGGIIGYASFLLNSTVAALAVAIIVLACLVAVMKKMTKSQKNAKWWLSNTAIVYLLVWFIVWAIFFNTTVIP